jgi:hypothetical protein
MHIKRLFSAFKVAIRRWGTTADSTLVLELNENRVARLLLAGIGNVVALYWWLRRLAGGLSCQREIRAGQKHEGRQGRRAHVGGLGRRVG